MGISRDDRLLSVKHWRLVNFLTVIFLYGRWLKAYPTSPPSPPVSCESLHKKCWSREMTQGWDTEVGGERSQTWRHMWVDCQLPSCKKPAKRQRWNVKLPWFVDNCSNRTLCYKPGVIQSSAKKLRLERAPYQQLMKPALEIKEEGYKNWKNTKKLKSEKKRGGRGPTRPWPSIIRSWVAKLIYPL